jgi:hypothetical protein
MFYLDIVGWGRNIGGKEGDTAYIEVVFRRVFLFLRGGARGTRRQRSGTERCIASILNIASLTGSGCGIGSS